MMTKFPEKFLLGALIGCAIGAAAALVFTPLSGESLRRRIAHGLNRSYGISKRKRPVQSRSHSPSHSHHHETAPHKVKRAPPKRPAKSAAKKHHSA